MTDTAAKATAYTPGAFVWHELYTTDIAKSQAFYKGLLGWRIEKSPMPDMAYFLVYVGDKQIAGIFQPEHPMNYWGGYVSVGDVDAQAKASEAAGGKLMVPPQDIPQVGRFACVADPQGAVFSLFKSAHGDPAGDAMPELGEFCWDSLNASDLDAALAFYQKAVGWQPEKNPGGAVFKYGDMMEASANAAPDGVPASWLSHIYVKDLAASLAKATELGGKVLMPDVDTGGWGRFGVIADPCGAVVALFQPSEQQG